MTTSCTTSTNKNSDEALVVATKGGDEEAFEELVLRHRQRVLAVAQRITRNPEDAEDEPMRQNSQRAYASTPQFGKGHIRCATK